MKIVPIRVECYAGHKADESPRILCWGGERFEVEEVVDRWYEGGVDPTVPIADYFAVRLRGGREVIVKRDRSQCVWFLVSE